VSCLLRVCGAVWRVELSEAGAAAISLHPSLVHLICPSFKAVICALMHYFHDLRHPSCVYTRTTLEFVGATNLIVIVNHCLELRMTVKINTSIKGYHRLQHWPLSLNGGRVIRNGLTPALGHLLLIDLRDDRLHLGLVVLQLNLLLPCGG